MRVAVCGATGFLGRPLVARLLAAGHEVTIVARAMRKGLPPSASLALWDPASEQPPDDTALDCDVFINLAGEPIAQRWTAEAKRLIYSSRVDANRRLVEAMRAAPRKPRLLISASGIGIYGDRGEEVLTEKSSPGSDWLARLCVDWETAARGAASFGVRVVVIRTGVVLGQGGGVLGRLLPVFRLGAGGPIGAGKQYMSWIHLDDILNLYLFAMQREEVASVLNGVAPSPVTNAAFSTALGSVLRRPAVLPVPPLALRVMFGEMSQVLLGSQRVLPEAASESGFTFAFPELEPALRNLLS